jgi:hypothetical protein
LTSSALTRCLFTLTKNQKNQQVTITLHPNPNTNARQKEQIQTRLAGSTQKLCKLHGLGRGAAKALSGILPLLGPWLLSAILLLEPPFVPGHLVRRSESDPSKTPHPREPPLSFLLTFISSSPFTYFFSSRILARMKNLRSERSRLPAAALVLSYVSLSLSLP